MSTHFCIFYHFLLFYHFDLYISTLFLHLMSKIEKNTVTSILCVDENCSVFLFYLCFLSISQQNPPKSRCFIFFAPYNRPHHFMTLSTGSSIFVCEIRSTKCQSEYIPQVTVENIHKEWTASRQMHSEAPEEHQNTMYRSYQ